jgi:ribosomal-protein-serine acetyltransferase
MPRPRLPDHLEDDQGLVLRRLTVEDAEQVETAVLSSLDPLRSWMPWAAQEPLSRDARRAMLAQRENEWRRGEDVMLGIFLDAILAGCTGLHRRIAPDGLEIGYWLRPDHQHRGLATRAVCLLTPAALAHPGITHVEIHTDQANTASAAVARRAGYTLVGSSPRARQAPAETGVELCWRMTAAPGPPAARAPALPL